MGLDARAGEPRALLFRIVPWHGDHVGEHTLFHHGHHQARPGPAAFGQACLHPVPGSSGVCLRRLDKRSCQHPLRQHPRGQIFKLQAATPACFRGRDDQVQRLFLCADNGPATIRERGAHAVSVRPSGVNVPQRATLSRPPAARSAAPSIRQSPKKAGSRARSIASYPCQ